jgi:hypothetical protein
MTKEALKEILTEYFARKFREEMEKKYHVDIINPKILFRVSDLRK